MVDLTAEEDEIYAENNQVPTKVKEERISTMDEFEETA